MKKTFILLLLVLLIGLMGCQNNTSTKDSNDNSQMNMAEVQNDTAIDLVKNNLNKDGHTGKIKIIQTSRSKQEFHQQTLERHEKAVNDFIKDKIVFDLDYSSYLDSEYEGFYNDNPYFTSNGTEYEWGYSTQVFYKDIE